MACTLVFSLWSIKQWCFEHTFRPCSAEGSDICRGWGHPWSIEWNYAFSITNTYETNILWSTLIYNDMCFFAQAGMKHSHVNTVFQQTTGRIVHYQHEYLDLANVHCTAACLHTWQLIACKDCIFSQIRISSCWNRILTSLLKRWTASLMSEMCYCANLYLLSFP